MANLIRRRYIYETLDYSRPRFPIKPGKFFLVADNVPVMADLPALQAFLGRVDLVKVGERGDTNKVVCIAGSQNDFVAALLISQKTRFNNKVLTWSLPVV